MTELDELAEMAAKLGEKANSVLNKAITPEVMEQMTDEQKELISQSRNAFTLDGATLDDKMDQLQKIIKDVANTN